MNEPREPSGGDVGTPLEPALAELLARLHADLEAVMAAVGALDQAQADWRPGPGRWSVGEVLHHLVLANRSFARVVAKLVDEGRRERVTVRPGSRRSWPRLRAIADANASGPVANPESATPSAGLAVEGLRRDLAETHRAVTAQIPALGALELAELKFPHPLGFELNLYQWADITGAHERRHLRQIEAILAEPAFPRRAR